MAKPKTTLWPLQRHTKAKHEVLIRYIDAWMPILGRWWPHLLIVDGFAGPGRYAGGEPGSPLLLLGAYVDHHADLSTTPHYVFIERDKARLDHLTNEISNDSRYACVDIETIHGDFSEVFPNVVGRYRREYPGIPIFAFIDPFGAGDDVAELSSKLVQLPRCEALMYVPIDHLARFVDSPDMVATLDRLYGDRSWEGAKAFATVSERRAELQAAFTRRMEKSCEFVRWFDIIPEDGGNTYSLFFGTNNRRGLQKMKEAMWAVDPVTGSRFRDSTNVDHPVLFEQSADLEVLLRMLIERFDQTEFTIESAAEFTLIETPFKDQGHLKPALKKAEQNGILTVVKSKKNRRRGSFPDRTMMTFAQAGSSTRTGGT